MPSVIVVFGATGKQGGSVLRCLARDSNFKVRAVTRDPGSPRARDLHSLGVEVCRADLNDIQSVAKALRDAYGVFLVTTCDLSDPAALNTEIAQGKNVADAAVASGVQHIIFSTQISMVRTLGIQCRHYDAKAEVCDYMIRQRLPLTSVSMPFFYENLYDLYKPQPTGNNNYQILIPVGSTSLDMMSVEDLGPVVNAVFRNREQYLSKTLSLSADKLTVKEIAQTLSTQLEPKTFVDRQITPVEFRTLGFPGCKDLANEFDFLQRVDQRRNVSTTKFIHPQLKNFEQWVTANRNKLDQCM